MTTLPAQNGQTRTNTMKFSTLLIGGFVGMAVTGTSGIMMLNSFPDNYHPSVATRTISDLTAQVDSLTASNQAQLLERVQMRQAIREYRETIEKLQNGQK